MKATKYVSFLSEVRREIQIHTSLNHPNIIKVIAVMDSDDSDKLYIGLYLIGNKSTRRG